MVAPKSEHIRQRMQNLLKVSSRTDKHQGKLPIQNPQTKRSYSSTYGLCCLLRHWQASLGARPPGRKGVVVGGSCHQRGCHRAHRSTGKQLDHASGASRS
jgi:hypothetical protein